ncbi:MULTISPECIES: hypothetical protein [unclassified Pseudovibrio]|uniref:hypothetical protein n=1 Tax=unclassified Pseudovibrio TaxID=2627060 RepID=UPI0007AE486D|nr:MULTISPECIES: hypothetical protein [unclassified Pseudovibrio]KZL02262.1 hypothetical protein PsW74_01360 [Pseudovibrio sp. W74]KZL08194.1 hypothetical protein PsAD14_03341 [Pseudovibrio sp. Ad14]
METTPNLNLPLLDSEENVSEDHKKINEFVKAFDARLGEVAVTLASLATAGHSHEMAKINGLAEALALLALANHAHKLNDLSDVDVTDAPENSILQFIAGKWSLGQRGYSVAEINNIVSQLASGDHEHPIGDVQGLSTKLATLAKASDLNKFADATKNAKFRKALSVLGDLYLNNKAIIANDSEGEFADRSGENIDHFWHDDSDNAWHFVSDGPYKSVGNTKFVAKRLDLLDTDWSMKSSDRWLARYRNMSENTENISANRFSDSLVLENKQYAPANASEDTGKRFTKRGLKSFSYIDGGSQGKTYEAFGGVLSTRHRGSSKVRSMGGSYSQCGTDTNSTGSVDYAYGARSYSFFNGSGRIGVCVGMHVGINPNHANARVGDARGIYTHMDYDDGTIENDPVALYQNYDGNWDGKKRVGIVQEGVQENRLTGKTLIDGKEAIDEGNLASKMEAAGLGGGGPLKVTARSTGTWTKHSKSKTAVVFLTASGRPSYNNDSGYAGATVVKIFDLRDGPSTGTVSIGSNETKTCTFKYDGHTLSVRGNGNASGHDAAFTTTVARGRDGNGGDPTTPASFWGTGAIGAARKGGVVIWEY